jgi:hypothetical protein
LAAGALGKPKGEHEALGQKLIDTLFSPNFISLSPPVLKHD